MGKQTGNVTRVFSTGNPGEPLNEEGTYPAGSGAVPLETPEDMKGGCSDRSHASP